jgi:hypothetical protein
MQIIKTNIERPNFTNISFKQEYEKDADKYRKLMSNIVEVFNRIEYLSVIEGTRDAHLLFIRPADVEHKRAEFRKYGLEIVLLNKEADNMSGNYGNHSLPWDGQAQFVWRSIVTKPELVSKWNDIWKTRERDVFMGEYLIGRGLGYPHCCSEHFTEVWMRRGGIDTTWQQAACTITNTSDYVEAENILGEYNAIELPETTPIWASNLLRWAGLKLVTHLPCSFNCTESKRIALENLGIATKYGYGYEYNMLCKMLDWEITWTAEYGVATIDTPVFTIHTLTDVTATPYKVIKKGNKQCIFVK